MKVIYHDSPRDWCHLCGKRKYPTADIWFPENAEHNKKNTRYIRVCSECAETIRDIALGIVPSENYPTKAEVWGSKPAGYDLRR